MASLLQTYRAAFIEIAGGPFVIRDVELKHPGRGQILIKVLACGICLTDEAVINGHMGEVFPRVPGHEIVGDIVEVGEGVTCFNQGERVGAGWSGGHCSFCRPCRRGQFQMCDDTVANGLTKDGGFAEYAILQSEAVVRVSEDIDPADAAPLLCAGLTVFNGIRKLYVEQGALVAIQGLGGLGHLGVQYASKMGYEVAVLSSSNDKAQFAKDLGAHHFINTKEENPAKELMKLGGASIIVQTAPDPKAIGPLVEGLTAGGTLLTLSAVGPMLVDTVTLVLKGVSVQGWPSGHALDSEEAIRFAEVHSIKCMVERYPLARVQEAYDSLLAGKSRFRNVLIME